MAITVSPSETDLGTTVIENNFSFAFTASTDDPISDGTITSTVLTAQFTEATAVIVNGVSNCLIAGKYTAGLFPNSEVKYIPKGKSDKNATPTIIRGSLNRIPQGQELFSLKPDTREQLINTYTITVNTTITSASFTYTHIVRQEYSAYKNFISNYSFGTA